jgi:hypothetical protein
MEHHQQVKSRLLKENNEQWWRLKAITKNDILA